jgi:hypothetical protein
MTIEYKQKDTKKIEIFKFHYFFYYQQWYLK